jgi:hypothetical protein
VLLDNLAQVHHGHVAQLVGARQDRLEERESEVLDEAVPKVAGAVIPPGARTEHAVVGEDEAVELIERPAALPEDAPCEMPTAEVEGKRAAGVDAGTARADGTNQLRLEAGRAGDEYDGCSEPVQRLQVVGDVRIDEAMKIEVCEQNERAATGRRLRWKLEVSFAKEAKNVATQAVAHRCQRALGFRCAACP